MVASVLALLFYQREHQIGAALAEGREHLGRNQYPEAITALQRGLALAENWPGSEAQRQALHGSLQRAQRLQNTGELHQMVNLLRFRFGIEPPEPGEARALYLRGREIWQSRDRILSPSTATSDAANVRGIRTDLTDLATILADMAAHQSPGPGASASAPIAEALKFLHEAESRLGPSPALACDHLRYSRALGLTDPSPTLPAGAPPDSAWEHYDLGRSYLRSGEHALGENEFRRSIELRPEEFWPHFYHGICCYKIGHHADAVASLGTAIALAPRTAECYFNRALAYQALGRDEDAIRDNTRALEFAPRFTDAALNRGIALYRTGRHAEALEDLQRARVTASNDRTLGLIDYNIALIALARDDLPTAQSSLRRAIKHGYKDARALFDRLVPP
jgi:tetratricopeptide (TPR) repeat protein